MWSEQEVIDYFYSETKDIELADITLVETKHSYLVV